MAGAVLVFASTLALIFRMYDEDGKALGWSINAGWALLMGALLAIGAAASLYLVYVLEILKFRRLRSWQLRHTDPDTSEHEIDEQVERELETGEFRSLA